MNPPPHYQGKLQRSTPPPLPSEITPHTWQNTKALKTRVKCFGEPSATPKNSAPASSSHLKKSINYTNKSNLFLKRETKGGEKSRPPRIPSSVARGRENNTRKARNNDTQLCLPIFFLHILDMLTLSCFHKHPTQEKKITTKYPKTETDSPLPPPLTPHTPSPVLPPPHTLPPPHPPPPHPHRIASRFLPFPTPTIPPHPPFLPLSTPTINLATPPPSPPPSAQPLPSTSLCATHVSSTSWYNACTAIWRHMIRLMSDELRL